MAFARFILMFQINNLVKICILLFFYSSFNLFHSAAPLAMSPPSKKLKCAASTGNEDTLLVQGSSVELDSAGEEQVSSSAEEDQGSESDSSSLNDSESIPRAPLSPPPVVPKRKRGRKVMSAKMVAADEVPGS
jgi:hypothetical protein